jgi:hypothetical protein
VNTDKSLHEYKLARTIACRNVRLTSQIAHNAKCEVVRHPVAVRENVNGYKNWHQYQAHRREAAIWHIIACLMKGRMATYDDKDPHLVKRAERQARKSEREELMKAAKLREDELRFWVSRNTPKAEIICAPLFAEYAERAKRRQEVVK